MCDETGAAGGDAVAQHWPAASAPLVSGPCLAVRRSAVKTRAPSSARIADSATSRTWRRPRSRRGRARWFPLVTAADLPRSVIPYGLGGSVPAARHVKADTIEPPDAHVDPARPAMGSRGGG